ncbi:MAG: hypothetical protein ACOYN4_05860 [Bacteroidales bacterium]
MLGGKQPLFPSSEVVERLARKFYAQIIEDKLVDRVVVSPVEKNIQSVDLDSIKLENVREIGSEWMCYQAARQLDLPGYFARVGFSPEETGLALTHIIGRAVHPASEHATAEWLHESTALCELLGMEP